MWNGAGMVLGLSLTFIVMGLITHWSAFADWATANEGVAEWAQALGGVLAIAGAFIVDNSQAREARRLEVHRRADGDLQRLGVIEALFTHAIALCRLFDKVWTDRGLPPSNDFRAIYWNEARSAIAAADPFLSPDPKIVFYLLTAPQQLDQLMQAHEDFLGSLGVPVDRGATAAKPRLDLEERLEKTLEFLEDALELCGRARENLETRKSA